MDIKINIDPIVSSLNQIKSILFKENNQEHEKNYPDVKVHNKISGLYYIENIITEEEEKEWRQHR